MTTSGTRQIPRRVSLVEALLMFLLCLCLGVGAGRVMRTALAWGAASAAPALATESGEPSLVARPSVPRRPERTRLAALPGLVAQAAGTACMKSC